MSIIPGKMQCRSILYGLSNDVTLSDLQGHFTVTNYKPYEMQFLALSLAATAYMLFDFAR